MSQPFLTDACVVPFIEKLVKKESKDTSKVPKKKSAMILGNKEKLSIWLDLLWTFLDVGIRVKTE